MDAELSRALFKERMSMIRTLVADADAMLAEEYYRQMMREIQKCAAKFRTGNTFIPMPIVKAEKTA